MSFAPVQEFGPISIETFVNNVVPPGQPIVIRGAVKDWPILEKANNAEALCDYVKAGAGTGMVSVMRADPSVEGRFFYAEDMRGFNYETNQMHFGEFLRILNEGANGDAIYMGSTPVSEGFPGLSGAFNMPLVPVGTEPRLWIGNRTVISTHHDTSSNIACVTAGQRVFTLFPPDQLVNLYPGPIEHTMAGPQVSLVDLDDPDLERYPRYAEALASAQQAELGPGDAIYIPPLWWHHVRALSDFNMLVNFWWDNRPGIGREPMEAFVLSLLAVRQLPDAEREAWRAMFDYFIFETNGPSMAHMDDKHRGVLGPINPERAQTIWRFFTNMMRG